MWSTFIPLIWNHGLPWVPKGRFKQLLIMKGRDVQTTGQSWVRVLVLPQGIHITLSLSFSVERKPPPKWKSLRFYIYEPVLSGVPHKERPSQTLWNLVEGAIREPVWKEILQQERSPMMWNLLLHLGNLGYIFGRIFVLPNIVGRTHCQQSLIPQICLNFDVWHMNFNNDMTSMRKKSSSLLSSFHSRQLWEATGWLTECSEEHVSSIWGWVPYASSIRELYWHHIWVQGSLQSHQMGSTVRSLVRAGGDRHWWLSSDPLMLTLSSPIARRHAHKTITLL